MPTTIQVSGATKQVLDLLKEKKQVKTHDRLIQLMLKKQLCVPKSMFGAVRRLKWKKGDRADFREL